ncbi:concanavalin A-like lectin/glucanase domain-containing protein [Microdochium trichocladiopsis]|uniref:Concanavalin A-like lectin/glucanase domain-containing protein n=1 Tax=Microdochium trichocladiopsis TaxID=1682393 RepID=A0A9P8YLR4_9PEZI|nr:concanavalin A-like lectin/glucanase domain-containing protein [Microdochium trichocladiopsis]KAH7041320.1 concanavalin A-like lectin/glucanase domain-containing protein [Microdochium trichocladiopsis]
MRFSLSLAAAGLASVAQAQFLVSDLSFGHTGRLEVGRAIPNFAIAGTPETPQVLSNKVILTPPAPGKARGSIWANNPNKYATWVADVDFRVGGPERGGGNLNIWLARSGSQEIGQSSIYTINKFDGLALVLDQHSGSGGMIRGFLNDGTIDFNTQPNIDSLAFGHCNYAYRNLGRPSQIKFRQTPDNFRVEIDGRLCFESNKISIPPGYSFGITAASADLPDSHEVFKMVVMTENLSATVEGSPPMKARAPESNSGQASSQNTNNNNGDPNEMADVDAASIKSSEAQFRDLHNRLQGINHQMGSIFRQISSVNNMNSNRHEEMQGILNEVQAVLGRLNRLDALEQKLDALSRDMSDMRRDLKNKIHDSEMSVKSAMGGQHGNMLEHVATQTAPRHGKLIFVIVASQFVIVGAYIYYERKKLSPKKYL